MGDFIIEGSDRPQVGTLIFFFLFLIFKWAIFALPNVRKTDIVCLMVWWDRKFMAPPWQQSSLKSRTWIKPTRFIVHLKWTIRAGGVSLKFVQERKSRMFDSLYRKWVGFPKKQWHRKSREETRDSYRIKEI